MVAFKVRVADAGTARGSISKKIGEALRDRATRAGEIMVEAANQAMAANFDLDRPFERRRSPGSRRASTALDYSIEGGPELPIRIGYRVLGGDDVLRRIIIMNFGSSPHEISPSGLWPLRGVTNIGSAGMLGTRREGGVTGVLAWVDYSGDVVVTGSVLHLGTGGAGFLETGQDAAVAYLTGT